MQQRLALLVAAGMLVAVGVGQIAAMSLERSDDTDSPYANPLIAGLVEIAQQDKHDAAVRLKLAFALTEIGEDAAASKWFAEAARIDPLLYEDVMSAQDGGPIPQVEGAAGSTYPVSGPDIIVGDLHQLQRFGRVGNITAFSVGTVSCNAGDTTVDWVASTNKHPVIAQHMYRFRNGRFEMIGQSWVKHGFTALTQNLCSSQFGYSCINPGSSSKLGIGCSDPYGSNLNGSYTYLGPKHEINATSGVFPYPFTSFQNNSPIGKRLQVHDDDLKPALNVNAVYYVEGHYIAFDDAAASNDLNNASYRRINILEGPENVFNLAFVGGQPTVREEAAIYAWKKHNPAVENEEIDVPGEGGGRFIVAHFVRTNGNGTWSYEYAVHNFNSDRSGGSFALPIPEGVTISNIGFHSVPWHSGAPYSTAAWTAEIEDGMLRWSTEEYSQNPDANALRWGTLYNFRFDADAAPEPANGEIGLFKPATDGIGPSVVTFIASVPGAPDGKFGDLDGNGVVNVFDLLILLAEWGDCADPNDCPADLDGDGVVDVFDLLMLLANWG